MPSSQRWNFVTIFSRDSRVIAVARGGACGYRQAQAPVAQLDRVLPSEGRGHRFESCRVRHFLRQIKTLK